MTAITSRIAALFITLHAVPALAEKADRDKPVHLEADRVVVDDRQQTHTYEGNVVLTQGTLAIRAARMVVKQDAEGYQRGIAYGGGPKGLASFRQKREGRDDYVEGEAERIEHDNRSEKSEFFQRAWVRSGNDEVTGQYIVYDARSENYMVSATQAGARSPAGDSRVRAVIQPRNKGEAATTAPPAKSSASPSPTSNPNSKEKP